MKKIFQNKFIQLFGVSFIIFFMIYRFFWFMFSGLNGEFLYFLKWQLGIDKHIDAGFCPKSGCPKLGHPSIVIVKIDDRTLETLHYPLDRSDYIPFLKNLTKVWPAVIGFDILFIDKWKSISKDSELASAFKKAGNIIIGADLNEQTKNGVQIIQPPYITFQNSVKEFWFFPPNIDKETGKVLSMYPFNKFFYKWKENYYESFAFAIMREYFNYSQKLMNSKFKKITFEDQNKNTDNWIYNFFWNSISLTNNKLFLNFIDSSSFSSVSFIDIYNWNFNPELLKDKIVIIGYTAEGVKDEFLLPGISITKWVYIHANIIHNILKNNFIVFFDKNIELIITFLFILFIVYLNIFYLQKINLTWIAWGAIIVFVFIIILYWLIFKISYNTYKIFLLPNFPTEFTSVLFLSFFASSILKYVNEDKNKTRLFNALSDYVSSDIANEILNGTWNINLDGEKKRITIFFSDIAWFTTISEKLSPEALVWFLKIYLWNMSDIIKANKWTIDKYEWDAIMAWWWVFGKIEKYWIIDACNSCLIQQMELKRLNEIWKKEWKNELSVRMGLNTWDAIVGNIWSKWKKMEYTALWDSVNLASRLEWVNKFYGTYICVSEDVYNEAKEKFTFRYLDKIRVKWKSIWINIYELISYIWEEWDFKRDIIQNFGTAMKFYFDKKFNEAFIIFSRLSEIWDNPSMTYKKRCEKYLVNPPTEDWDGIWVLDEK